MTGNESRGVTWNATMKLLKQSRVSTTELFQSPAKSMILKALLQKPVCKKLIASIIKLLRIITYSGHSY